MKKQINKAIDAWKTILSTLDEYDIDVNHFMSEEISAMDDAMLDLEALLNPPRKKCVSDKVIAKNKYEHCAEGDCQMWTGMGCAIEEYNLKSQ